MESNNYVITHYFSPHTAKLRNIMSYSELEKAQIISILQNMQGIGFNRFKKHKFYMRIRMKTEQWLYEEFILGGGKPSTSTPIYFVFGQSPHMSTWYGHDTLSVTLNLAEIAEDDISFTIKDSLMTYILESNNAYRRVFNKREIINIVECNDKKDFHDYYFIHNKYIEAQLWNYQYLAQYMEE